VDIGKACRTVNALERDVEIFFRELHDASNAASADTIGDEDHLTRLEPTDPRVVCGFFAERNCHARRERLIR